MSIPGRYKTIALAAVAFNVLVWPPALSHPAAQSPAGLEPRVHWNPNAINAIITPGTETEIQVSLIAGSVGPVTFRVVPEIDPYVDVIPPAVSNLTAGETVAVRVIVRTSPNALPGSFDGTIQVRELSPRKNGRTLPRPLPVRIVIREQQDSLAGVDGDGNGVWDYIDQYIDSRHAEAESASTRAAARQYARALQGALVNATDKGQSLLYASLSDRATECMYHIRRADAKITLRDLEAAILNTATRSRVFIMWSEQSAGQVFPGASLSTRGTSCLAE